ncbi:hypothetical protein ACWEF9_06135 [Streptomyces sp. NPDC004980]
MTRPRNRDRSLEELERTRRPAPSADDTRLVATAHALRLRPIGELTELTGLPPDLRQKVDRFLA